MTDLQTPTVDDYANADTLPAAVALNRRFIAYERHWSHEHRETIGAEHHTATSRKPSSTPRHDMLDTCVHSAVAAPPAA